MTSDASQATRGGTSSFTAALLVLAATCLVLVVALQVHDRSQRRQEATDRILHTLQVKPEASPKANAATAADGNLDDLQRALSEGKLLCFARDFDVERAQVACAPHVSAGSPYALYKVPLDWMRANFTEGAGSHWPWILDRLSAESRHQVPERRRN